MQQVVWALLFLVVILLALLVVIVSLKHVVQRWWLERSLPKSVSSINGVTPTQAGNKDTAQNASSIMSSLLPVRKNVTPFRPRGVGASASADDAFDSLAGQAPTASWSTSVAAPGTASRRRPRASSNGPEGVARTPGRGSGEPFDIASGLSYQSDPSTLSGSTSIFAVPPASSTASLLRLPALGLDAYSLSGHADPVATLLRRVDQDLTASNINSSLVMDMTSSTTSTFSSGLEFAVKSAVAAGSQEERRRAGEEAAAAQRPRGAGYRQAASEHPPGELLPVAALPRHVALTRGTTLLPGGDLPPLDMLSSSFKAYLAGHIKRIFLPRFTANAAAILERGPTDGAGRRCFTKAFLERRCLPEVTPAQRAAGIGAASIFDGLGALSSSGSGSSLSALFPVHRLTFPGHPTPVTLDGLCSEYTWREDSRYMAPVSSSLHGIRAPSTSSPAAASLRSPHVNLWREKAELESFLWAGPGFSTSAATAAASSSPSGGGSHAFDIRGYALTRLEAIASQPGLATFLGDEVGFGRGVMAGSSSSGGGRGFGGGGFGLGFMSSSQSPDTGMLSLLPTDAQLLWHYAVTLLDDLVAQAAGKGRTLKIDDHPPSVLDRIFSATYVDFGHPSRAASSSSSVSLGGLGSPGQLLGSPSAGSGAGGCGSARPTLRPSLRFKLHCINEAPRLQVVIAADGVPVATGHITGADGSRESLPRAIALFAYLQVREAGGDVAVHRDASVSLREELAAMCGATPAHAVSST